MEAGKYEKRHPNGIRTREHKRAMGTTESVTTKNLVTLLGGRISDEKVTYRDSKQMTHAVDLLYIGHCSNCNLKRRRKAMLTCYIEWWKSHDTLRLIQQFRNKKPITVGSRHCPVTTSYKLYSSLRMQFNVTKQRTHLPVQIWKFSSCPRPIMAWCHFFFKTGCSLPVRKLRSFRTRKI